MEDGLRGTLTMTDDVIAQDWDYVIVGAGSAGCVVARRLSDDPAIRVLLLEAGAPADDPAIFQPQAWPMLQGGRHDWNYTTVPQVGLNGRRVAQPRGKGLGGSSLINALGFQRGSHVAYDRWAAETGDAGWSYDGLLPWFRKLETASCGANDHRGENGPLDVLALGDTGDESPYAYAVAAAGVAAGYPLNPDWNAADAEGTIWTQLTMKNGRRVTAASAYLDPIRDRANLRIVCSANVRRVAVAEGRCKGVTFATGGALHHVTPLRETILCAGAIDTPRLLLLSGIGDPAELAPLGVTPVHDLPGVGRNLIDHPLVPGLLFKAARPLPPSAYNHCETMVIVRSSIAGQAADLQLMALAVPFLSLELGAPPPDSFSIVPALMDPHSRGSVRLASADPDVPALIDPAYLTEPRDVEALVDGFEIARAVARQPALADWIESELVPGAVTNRVALASHIRRTASPFFHPVSTCRMSHADDPLAVVDTICRVRGVAQLRIVDASIFPSIPQAMTNAAVLAVAERAADLILHA
jgi:choline dehydrogenase